jgi:hypothetical protein
MTHVAQMAVSHCQRQGMNFDDCQEIVPEVTEEFEDMRAYSSKVVCEKEYKTSCEADASGWFIPALGIFVAAEVADEIGDLRKERRKARRDLLNQSLSVAAPSLKINRSMPAGVQTDIAPQATKSPSKKTAVQTFGIPKSGVKNTSQTSGVSLKKGEPKSNPGTKKYAPTKSVLKKTKVKKPNVRKPKPSAKTRMKKTR